MENVTTRKPGENIDATGCVTDGWQSGVFLLFPSTVFVWPNYKRPIRSKRQEFRDQLADFRAAVAILNKESF